jgi:hypothetical protein
MNRSVGPLGGSLLTLLALACGASAEETRRPGPASTKLDPAAVLVRQLGADSFQVREQASNGLIRLGRAAKSALQAGLQDSDLEIRRRCQYLLPIALKRDLEVRLAAFIADKDGKTTCDLPGWTRYRQLVGTDAAARQFFVDVQKADADLLETSESQPAAAGDKFAVRCQFLQQFMYNPTNQGPPITLADIANLLLVGTDPQVKVPMNVTWQFTNLLNFQLTQKLRSDRHSPLVKKLLIQWVKQRTDDGALGQTLDLVMKLDLKEGLDIALKELKNPSAQAYNRAMALMTVAKLDGKKHLDVFEPLLKETGQVGNFGFNNVRGTTEVRDVALAMLIHLNGQKIKDYDFIAAEIFGGDELNFQNGPIFLGFADSTKRDAAMKKWKEWSAKQTKK